MASILKVDKLDPQSGTALEIGTSGDTISVPSGATLDISASTLTPPATMPASSGINLTALNATNLGSGTVPTARLGTGTASSSTVLYGDQTYKAEPGLTGWSTDSGSNDSLVPDSTSAGIYLGVDAATAANLLDDYEEGTWSPTWGSESGDLTSTSGAYGKYTKVGNMVQLWFGVTFDSGTASEYYKMFNSPFTSATNSSGTGAESTTGTLQNIWWDSGGTQVNINDYDGTFVTDAVIKVSIIMQV